MMEVNLLGDIGRVADPGLNTLVVPPATLLDMASGPVSIMLIGEGRLFDHPWPASWLDVRQSLVPVALKHLPS